MSGFSSMTRVNDITSEAVIQRDLNNSLRSSSSFNVKNSFGEKGFNFQESFKRGNDLFYGKKTKEEELKDKKKKKKLKDKKKKKSKDKKKKKSKDKKKKKSKDNDKKKKKKSKGKKEKNGFADKVSSSKRSMIARFMPDYNDKDDDSSSIKTGSTKDDGRDYDSDEEEVVLTSGDEYFEVPDGEETSSCYSSEEEEASYLSEDDDADTLHRELLDDDELYADDDEEAAELLVESLPKKHGLVNTTQVATRYITSVEIYDYTAVSLRNMLATVLNNIIFDQCGISFAKDNIKKSEAIVSAYQILSDTKKIQEDMVSHTDAKGYKIWLLLKEQLLSAMKEHYKENSTFLNFLKQFDIPRLEDRFYVVKDKENSHLCAFSKKFTNNGFKIVNSKTKKDHYLWYDNKNINTATLCLTILRFCFLPYVATCFVDKHIKKIWDNMELDELGPHDIKLLFKNSFALLIHHNLVKLISTFEILFQFVGIPITAEMPLHLN